MAAGWRNALAAIGVLVTLAALIAVPAVVQATLPEEGPLPSGERFDLGYGVSLRPPSGARLDLAASRPGSGDAVLLVHDLTVRLSAVPVRERPAGYISHTRHKLHRDDGFDVGAPEPVRTESGVSGQRADLRVSADRPGGRPGCVGIFTAENSGVVAVISPVRGCAAVPADVWSAVTSMTFERVDEW